MKMIGLIGGISWTSTIAYYRRLNELTRAKLGSLHSARCLIHSVDFESIEALQRRQDWVGLAQPMLEASLSLQAGGADCILIGANTMHITAPFLIEHLEIPILHIATATANRLLAEGHRRVLLLGTRFTMDLPFYREHLERRGLEVLLPGPEDRAEVNRIIYQELCLDQRRTTSAKALQQIIARADDHGAEAAILGCTELGLLLQSASLPLYDTLEIHVEAAVDWALT